MIRDLLAGYTDLEIGLLHCVQIVRNDFDVVLKAMFRVRGETARINVADGIGRHHYRQLGLENSFDKAISAMRHCVKIRGLREIEWVNFGGGSAKNLCIG